MPIDHTLRLTNAQELNDHDFHGEDAPAGSYTKTLAVVNAMREVAEDYKCSLCGAQQLLKTCLDCLNSKDIDHDGRADWDRCAGVDAW